MRRFHNLDNNIDILNIKMKKDNKCIDIIMNLKLMIQMI